MNRSPLLALAACPLLASACLNDRDTLGYELRNKPDVQRALTGRFERNPPLYYQMRVDRLVTKGRLTADEIDDHAVALDRLGRSREAIRVIERKKTLPNLSKEDWYRFYANRGTFQAHLWLHNGAKKSELKNLKAAASDIKQALAIKPDAHFGREAVQHQTILWMIDSVVKPKEASSLGVWLSDKTMPVDPEKGLAGLILLGNAWESPDVAYALAELTNVEGQHALTEMAFARYEELQKIGRKRLPWSPKPDPEAELLLGLDPPAGEPPVAETFAHLRKEADKWHGARTGYMLARLKVGRHPDSDAQFWSEWKEPAMPELSSERREGRLAMSYRKTGYLVMGILAGGIIAVGSGTVFFVRSRRRKARLHIR